VSPIVRMGQVATGLALVALLGLLVYGLTARAPDDAIDQGLSEGEPVAAPDFNLDIFDIGAPPRALAGPVGRALRDDRFELHEFSGTPIVLNFWASWCEPCREEAPVLESRWRSWGPRGVLFLGLNMQDATPDARAFLDEFSIDYPTIRDPGDAVASDYGHTGIPETYFIDARGRAVGHTIGVLSPEQLDRGAQAAIEGEVIPPSSGGDTRPPR
jgi:cytochrome c biogenesis protein CcmG/thiol:disulfide interchange protein DsbE